VEVTNPEILVNNGVVFLEPFPAIQTRRTKIWHMGFGETIGGFRCHPISLRRGFQVKRSLPL